MAEVKSLTVTHTLNEELWEPRDLYGRVSIVNAG